MSCCVPRGPRDAPLYGTAPPEVKPSRVPVERRRDPHRHTSHKPWPAARIWRNPGAEPSRRGRGVSSNTVIRPQNGPCRLLWRHAGRRRDAAPTVVLEHVITAARRRCATLRQLQKDLRGPWGIQAPEITRPSRTTKILRRSSKESRCVALQPPRRPWIPPTSHPSLGTGTNDRPARVARASEPRERAARALERDHGAPVREAIGVHDISPPLLGHSPRERVAPGPHLRDAEVSRAGSRAGTACHAGPRACGPCGLRRFGLRPRRG
mgnify:CR=1 FL=1